VEQKVTFDDGATTTLESWGQNGPAVICVHGITSSRKAWERTALALQESFCVFAYDQRGHGDSAACPGPMTLQRSVDDLRAVAHEIGESAALIGHSWGGAVALLGGREPFATRVVAIDPMVHVEPGSWRRDYLDDAQRDLALEPAQLRAELLSRLAAWHEKDVEGKLHAVRHMKADAIARLGSDNRVDEGGWDLRNIVAGYPKPLLVFAAGPDDSVIAPNDLVFIEAQGGPNVRVEMFADQGHNLHRTAFDRYITATSAFLEQ
jgi:pimeloyl-ACP methyl ester carboxylesterase